MTSGDPETTENFLKAEAKSLTPPVMICDSCGLHDDCICTECGQCGNMIPPTSLRPYNYVHWCYTED